MIVIQTLTTFDKELKRLAKKYHSIHNDYSKLIEELENNPLAGVDLGKGKSHGAHIITYTDAIVSVEEGIVTLLLIYDKSERNNISDKEQQVLLSQVL